MQPDSGTESKPVAHASAAEHVAGAHRLMKALQDKVGEHPELTEAIRDLEMALSVLTVNTAGLL